MTIQPVYLQPGICKNTSPYSAGKTFAYTEGRIAQGRYVDGNNIRFVAGFPEKVGGWAIQACSVATGPLLQIVRASTTWSVFYTTGDEINTSAVYVIVGVANRVYAANVTAGTSFIEVTPLRSIGSLTTAFTFSSTGSSLPNNQITISDVAGSAFLQEGDLVGLSGSAFPIEDSDGNIVLPNGWYNVQSVTSGTGYVIVSTIQYVNAFSVTTPDTGATIAYQRQTQSNPISTQSGSAVVTIVYDAHGCTTGDYGTIVAEDATGGITVDGEYTITVVDDNTFTITIGSPATSTVSSEGGTVSFQFNIHNPVASTGVLGWQFAQYGSQMLLAPIGGSIYVFDPRTNGTQQAYPQSNDAMAPTSVYGLFVTPETFIVALGGNDGALTIQWADVETSTEWTPTENNTAEIRNIQGGSYFVSGIGARLGSSLAFTDNSTFLFSYTGDANIYITTMIADNCGLIGPEACEVLGECIYWMSDSDFWTWNGSVSALPSDDIREYVFSTLNRGHAWKCFAYANRAYKEIYFHYPSTVAGDSSECNSYVIFHTDQQCWSIGARNVTNGTNAKSTGPNPWFFDYYGNMLQLEYAKDNVYNNGTEDIYQPLDTWIETAMVDISGGTSTQDVFGFLLDVQRQTGNLTVTINSQYYPTDPINTDGPYIQSPTDPGRLDLRADGKMIGYKIETDLYAADFRLGLCRVDIQPSGQRR